MSKPLTTRQAAAELGFAPATVIKLAPELGGYRSGDRGAWRFPAERVRAFKGREVELRKPNATVQALAKEVADLTALCKERENRFRYEFEKFERRLACLEQSSRTATIFERAA